MARPSYLLLLLLSALQALAAVQALDNIGSIAHDDNSRSASPGQIRFQELQHTLAQHRLRGVPFSESSLILARGRSVLASKPSAGRDTGSLRSLRRRLTAVQLAGTRGFSRAIPRLARRVLSDASQTTERAKAAWHHSKDNAIKPSFIGLYPGQMF